MNGKFEIIVLIINVPVKVTDILVKGACLLKMGKSGIVIYSTIVQLWIDFDHFKN